MTKPLTHEEHLGYLQHAIDAAQQNVEAARVILRRAEIDLRETRCSLAAAKWDARCGALVKNTRTKKTGTIIEVRPQSWNPDLRPDVRVVVDKKDGTPGSRMEIWYMWELAL